MKNKIKLFFLIIMIAVSLTACTTVVNTVEEVELVVSLIDDTGFVLEFEDNTMFTSIASLAPSTTEIIFWLESEEDLILREDNSYYPEGTAEIESMGSIWGGIPYELLIEKDIDLVIAAEIVSLQQVEEMREIGLTVFYMANPQSFEELFEDFYQISILTSSTDVHDQKISTLTEKYKNVIETIKQAKDTPAVFIELDATDPTKPYTVAGGTFVDTMIQLAGGYNIASEIDNPWPQIDTEFLIEKNPEVILMADYEWGVTIESLIEREGYDVINAVQNLAIYPIYSYETSVPGPRMVDGFENMAKMIHPELFE